MSDNFIERVARIAVKDWRERRIMLPSIVIAQAIKESGMGTSELATEVNALFGIKLNGWTGKSYREKADEQNQDGAMREDPECLWRAYDCWEDSVIDHNTYILERNFSNGPNFKAVIGETNLKKAIAGLVGSDRRNEVAARCTDLELRQYVLAGTTQYGYATGLSYPQSLLSDYIIKYDLTKYDNEENVMHKVFLSAGHGGSDPGASAYGMKEKDINLNILLACHSELVRHGITVVCSRVKDENDPVNEEVAEANASGAAVAVSFHTNAGGGDGSETFYYPGSASGERLANLCEKYTKELGQNSRGIKSGKNLRFVNGTKMPAVLCESAFIDNDADNDIIDTMDEQKAFGVVYAKAILEYFGIPYNSGSNSVDPDDGPNILYKVQCGAYRNRENAEDLKRKLEAAGFSCFIAESVQ